MLRAALGQLLADYERARDACWRAATGPAVAARPAARTALQEAEARWGAACQEMADLLLVLLRHALVRRPEALAGLLRQVLAPTEGKSQ